MSSLLGLNGLQELFQGEFGRLAELDNLPLLRADSGSTSGMRAAISSGRETTPWTSAYSRSPDRSPSPKISNGAPKSTTCMYAWETNAAEANTGNSILLTEGISRTHPLVITPSHCRALRTAACTSPTVEAPLAVETRSWKTAMRGTGSRPIVSHQSVRSTYALPDIGGSADRTRQVAAYPSRRGAPPVTHCRPGRVNPSLRNRTLKCSIALAIVQVSNCRTASRMVR